MTGGVRGIASLRAAAIGPAPAAYAGVTAVASRPSGQAWLAVVTACLTLLLMGCGGTVAAKDIPPAGQIWFGQSFDPQTFALTGQRTTVGTQEPVALVAHLTKPIEGNVTIRASLGGALIGSAPIEVTGSGEVFGYVLGALVTPGEYRYDIVDIGGNVLASGIVTAQ